MGTVCGVWGLSPAPGQLHWAVLGPPMPLGLNGVHQGPQGLQLGLLQAKDGTRPGTRDTLSQGAPGRRELRAPVWRVQWRRESGLGEGRDAGGGGVSGATEGREAGRAARPAGSGTGEACGRPQHVLLRRGLQGRWARGSQASGSRGRRPPPGTSRKQQPRGAALALPGGSAGRRCDAGGPRNTGHVSPPSDPSQTRTKTLVAGLAGGRGTGLSPWVRGEAGRPGGAETALRRRAESPHRQLFKGNAPFVIKHETAEPAARAWPKAIAAVIGHLRL